MKYIYWLITGVIFLIVSCSHPRDKPVKLNGTYTPKTINWKDGVFETIIIRDDTLFVKITSANQLINGDSISFRKVPGMIVDVGALKWIDGDDYEIAYRRYFREITLRGEKLPGNLIKDTITLKIDKRDTGFIYEGKPYHRTKMFNIQSRKAFGLILDKSIPWWLGKRED